jgi:DNA-directed RNA polymerase specialized sigma24 family protein
MEPDRDDDGLLVAAADDPEAFAAFYRLHVRGVIAYFRRRVGNAELAADLTAETFAAALEGRRRFAPERGPAAAWLYGIALLRARPPGRRAGRGGLPAPRLRSRRSHGRERSRARRSRRRGDLRRRRPRAVAQSFSTSTAPVDIGCTLRW